MKKMGHPYIIKLIEIIDDPDNKKLYLIQELIRNKDLQRKIDNKKVPMTEDQVRKYFMQLLQALWYCHEVVHILHRDIKPDNILVDSDDNIRLADFGVSKSFHGEPNDLLSDNAGSKCYYSPEACSIKADQTYSGKDTDLWACGVTLYQMIFSKLPFNSKTECCLYETICDEQPSLDISQIQIKATGYNTNLREEQTIHSTIKDNMSFNHMINLLKRMLNKNPKERITMDEIQEHPWITLNGLRPVSWKNDVNFVEFSDVKDEDFNQEVTQIKQKTVMLKAKI